MFGSKRRIKPMTLNSINGYASEVSLVCFINDNLNMYINDHLRMYTSDYALI